MRPFITLLLALSLTPAQAIVPFGTAADPLFVSCSLGQQGSTPITITSTMTITGTDSGGKSFITSGGIDVAGDALIGGDLSVAGSITGTVNGSNIVAGSIDSTKLASNSVTTTKVLAGAIDTGKLGSDAVTTVKILNGAVDTNKLGSASVTTIKIAVGAIDTNKLANDSVTNAAILKGSIDTSKLLASSAVDTGKIVCFKPTGKLGYCSVSVVAGVTCTCN